VPEEHIAVGAGSLGVAANLLAAMSVTQSAEIMYAWGTGYAGYETVCRIAGARSMRVPMVDGVRQDLDAMARNATLDTRVIILGSPHNPTGTVIGHRELEAFLRQVPAGTIVLLDEAYHDFVRDPAAADGLALCRKYPNLAVLRTFSAAHGLAGLRVGYLVADPVVIERVLRRTPPFAVTSVAEQAAVASLRADHELAGRVDWIVGERERVAAELRARGFVLSRSEASFLWIAFGDEGIDLAAAFRRSDIDVRLTTDGGIRITIGSAVANDAVVAAATTFAESRASTVAGTRRARASLVAR
jgi:histidinol-phosphate aminotransferase